ncbi:chromate transporter [Burkholderia multivorans]|uniref:chromate transporter n=1 Tax=Burkholderia multivorans TaxID=87883 RepID=UPI000CFEBE0F|nr:chromate transporter [Burkholderia multivorans]MBR7895769.1 chromate transporter [Burkholderia multivorans]MBR8455175.1 chromate transporter [Burkholderia multivorans]MBU9451612.1 chromate transporter [Burkholderia multivorans]MCL4647913.1 chromate transporter [Burkholderia multivorans]PRG38130.1 chromate transporter [Burkholderia multivorans]
MTTTVEIETPERIDRASLLTLFKVVLGISAVSWGGLSMMAQLERHYVHRVQRIDAQTFADLVSLAWLVPGPVGCNVAVQVGQTLHGRAGAWIAGIASVLPFFALMTLFAIFYRTPLVRSLAAPMLLNHFGMVLAALIGVTWVKQLRTLARTRREQAIAALSTILLAFAHSPAAFVGILFAAFAAGWLSGPQQHDAVGFALSRRDRNLLVLLAILVALFALPLPGHYQATLLWPRLAGAGMTLFGGGFSALPVLKTLFVTPATGISEHDFTLAFALSPVSPGPLLNVVPFLGYLTDGWVGALLATAALFIPSGCLVVFAQRHLQRLRRHSRFEHGMRLLRAATTGFLVVAVVKILHREPANPAYWLTGAFAALCFARFKVPVYAVYGAVAMACGAWLLAAH